MNQTEAPASFVAKWRARWPEWNIVQVFIPAAQRDRVDAWFALLQTLTDAAWGGSDPTPGLAKLAWWQEELQGWSKGARRHPLGEALQRFPAPWAALAASVMSLQQTRARADDAQAAMAVSQPFAAAVAACESALFGVSVDATALIGKALLGERLLVDPESAVPLRQSDSADAPTSSARAWALQLLTAWPEDATRPRRLQTALLRARLVHFAQTGDNAPLAPWRTLFVAWWAARKG